MTTLSLILSDELANASFAAAKRLGISRTEFIRQAIQHELQSMQAKIERQAIIQSILAMKKSKTYLQEAEEIDDLLNSTLPQEEEQWWMNKS